MNLVRGSEEAITGSEPAGRARPPEWMIWSPTAAMADAARCAFRRNEMIQEGVQDLGEALWISGLRWAFRSKGDSWPSGAVFWRLWRWLPPCCFEGLAPHPRAVWVCTTAEAAHPSKDECCGLALRERGGLFEVVTREVGGAVLDPGATRRGLRKASAGATKAAEAVSFSRGALVIDASEASDPRSPTLAPSLDRVEPRPRSGGML
jgi:hypothetical protein